MRALLFVLVLGAVVSANAQPRQIAATTDTTYYADPASLADRGEFRLVTVVHDLAQAEPSGVRSRRVTYEVECVGERLRSVAINEYPQPMAQGSAAVSVERVSDWLIVAPRTGSHIGAATPYRAIVRFACAR